MEPRQGADHARPGLGSRHRHDVAAHLREWRLSLDGEPFLTVAAILAPVRTASGEAAMLKVARATEERFGAAVMAWWDGDGAARVIAHDDDALLLERAQGPRTLARLSRNGADDDASRILCAGAARLHHPRAAPPPAGLTPLDIWFRALFPAAQAHGGALAQAAEVARWLLSNPQDVVVLHGDLHHANVLDFGSRGWLAIDPKGLLGERGFDFANLFCNPDPEIAHAPGRLARQAGVIAEAARLDRGRLLEWVLAWSGLSAVWKVEDGETTEPDLSLVELALAELRRD